VIREHNGLCCQNHEWRTHDPKIDNTQQLSFLGGFRNLSFLIGFSSLTYLSKQNVSFALVLKMADDQRVMYDGFSGKGPSDLLAPTTAAPWGATQLGAAFGWRNLGGGYRLDGQRDLDADSRGRDF
jgi:hypothetical protein